LASNSLLEGLVFGLEAADTLNTEPSFAPQLPADDDRRTPIKSQESTDSSIEARRSRLQQTMSRFVAVVRDGEGLKQAASEMVEILAIADNDNIEPSRDVWELINMATAASAIVHAAFRRAESRGAHFRSDYPETNPALDGQHFILGGEEIRWRLGELASARAKLTLSA
jgi:aspartate oxidase